MGQVSPEIQGFMDTYVRNLEGAGVKKSNYGYPQWQNAKAGVVNHIPVCDTLEQLDAYFTGGAAQGSTHYGVGRPTVAQHTAFAFRFPVAQVSRYVAITGPFAPWAQGIIQQSSACPIPPSPSIAGKTGGELNSAYVSVENVARSGNDGVTDAQFNSNVLLRAYAAQRFDHAITPLTQLWHSEIDQRDRCFDPGWPGALEDEMQSAANALLAGDASRMRAAVAIPPPEPEPIPPEPEPAPSDPLLYFGVYEGMAAKLDTGFWHPDPATRSYALTALYADLGKLMPQ